MRRGADLRVADVIRAQATARAAHPAVQVGALTLTFGELDQRSSRLAQALIADGVGPGDRVAYLDRAAPEVLELLFAVSKIGAVIVPMNWRLSAPELAAVLRDSRARVLIAGSTFASVAEALVQRVPEARRLVIAGEDSQRGYEPWLAVHEPADPGHTGAADDVVVQMYTSGT